MKTKITLAVAAVALLAMSFKMSIEKSGAVAQEVNGVHVFAFSKPAGKYDILGMVKIKGMVKNEKGPHMVDLLIEAAKKDYPSGEGIIVNSEFEKAEVIKFRD